MPNCPPQPGKTAARFGAQRARGVCSVRPCSRQPQPAAAPVSLLCPLPAGSSKPQAARTDSSCPAAGPRSSRPGQRRQARLLRRDRTSAVLLGKAGAAPGSPPGVGVVKCLWGKAGAAAASWGFSMSSRVLPVSAGLSFRGLRGPTVSGSGWCGMSLGAHPAAEDNRSLNSVKVRHKPLLPRLPLSACHLLLPSTKKGRGNPLLFSMKSACWQGNLGSRGAEPCFNSSLAVAEQVLSCLCGRGPVG